MMICDRRDLAVHFGYNRGNIVFSYAGGFERTGEIDLSGQISCPLPKIPLGDHKLNKIAIYRGCVHVKSQREFLEKIWETWSPLRKNTRSFISITPASITYDVFWRATKNNPNERKFSGPNPITDLGQVLQISHKSMWKFSRKIDAHLKQFWELKNDLIIIPIPLKKISPLDIAVDVEAWGLMGKIFSIGYAVFHKDKCLESGRLNCEPDDAFSRDVTNDDAKWVREHVLKHDLGKVDYSPSKLIQAFKKITSKYNGARFVVERGYPLEARLFKLLKITRDFIDVCSLVKLLGIELKRDTEKYPLHDPLHDARWAHCQYRKCLEVIQDRR